MGRLYGWNTYAHGYCDVNLSVHTEMGSENEFFVTTFVDWVHTIIWCKLREAPVYVFDRLWNRNPIAGRQIRWIWSRCQEILAVTVEGETDIPSNNVELVDNAALIVNAA
jgi:hypothetical protein